MEGAKKAFPSKWNMQQFRFVKAIGFTCCRCNEDKKAKLVTQVNGDPSKLMCNGCYGWLLSKGTSAA